MVLLEAPAGDRQSYINDSVKARVWHSQRYFDEEKIKTDYARSYDRSFYPEGQVGSWRQSTQVARAKRR